MMPSSQFFLKSCQWIEDKAGVSVGNVGGLGQLIVCSGMVFNLCVAACRVNACLQSVNFVADSRCQGGDPKAIT